MICVFDFIKYYIYFYIFILWINFFQYFITVVLFDFTNFHSCQYFLGKLYKD